MQVGTNKQGFTIVELLIVVIVIAILATITIVSFNNIQSRARTSAVASELTQASKTIRLAAADAGQVYWPLNVIKDGVKSLKLDASKYTYAVYCANASEYTLAVST